MNKFILSFMLILTTNCYARYELYECQNDEQSRICSSGCSKARIPIDRYEFKVNSSNNSVIIDYYNLHGKYIESRALTKCSVVNKQNWICSEGEGLDAIMHESIFRWGFLKNQCMKDSLFN